MNTPEVVIPGAGFGGLNVARSLVKTPVHITLIDRQKYHLFQPLLYLVAIACLLPSEIAYPLRTIYRQWKNLTVPMGEVAGIDFEQRYERLNGSVIAYDDLVVARGAETNFFGMETVPGKTYSSQHSAPAGQSSTKVIPIHWTCD